MDVKIRKATSSDLAIIQKLNHDLFISDSSSDNMMNLNWPFEKDGENYFRDMIAEKIGVCYVAELDGQVIGYLAGCIKLKINSYRPVKEAELENMIVVDSKRSKGVGASLVEAFLKWCKVKKAQKVSVRAYSPNRGAIKFYKKMGFKPYVTELEQDC